MEKLTGEFMREYVNFVHSLSIRTASRNASISNSRSYFYLFSVKDLSRLESKVLLSVLASAGLRLSGRGSVLKQNECLALSLPSALKKY